MVVPEYQDGKTDFTVELTEAITGKLSSRQGDKVVSKEKPKVIVDMREFRSELPCLIHKRGLEVVPVTITVSLQKGFTFKINYSTISRLVITF